MESYFGPVLLEQVDTSQVERNSGSGHPIHIVFRFVDQHDISWFTVWSNAARWKRTKDPSRWCRSTGTHSTHQKGLYIDLYVLCVSYICFHIILLLPTIHLSIVLPFHDCPTSCSVRVTIHWAKHLLGGLLGAWAWSPPAPHVTDSKHKNQNTNRPFPVANPACTQLVCKRTQLLT